MTSTIDLRIGELEGRADVLEESQTTSVSTGAELATIKVSLTVRGDEANEAVSTSLSSGGSGVQTSDGRSFESQLRMSSHREGTNAWYYEIELQETDGDLMPDVLIIDGVEISPRAYRERADSGALIIECLAMVGEEHAAEIEARLVAEPPLYFLVERPGIQSGAREMRFGKCVWSRDGERTKYRLVLVEKIYDENDDAGFLGFNEPELSNVMRELAILRELFDRLLDVLAEQNALGATTLEALKDVTSEQRRKRSRQFDEVDDADDPQWWR